MKPFHGHLALPFLLLLVCTAPVAADEPGTRYFDSRDIELDVVPETAGAAPVAHYQIWYTTDDGRTWQPGGAVHRGPPPVKFSAPADGRYGFRAVGVDRAGHRQAAPQPGDAPELSCVIDTRKPRLDVRSPRDGSELYAGSLVIFEWQSDDENLGVRPVTIEFRRAASAPWQPVNIADAYPGSDRQDWFTPFADGQLEFRLRVEDLAGNHTEWVSSKPLRIVPFTGFRGSRNIAAAPYAAFRRFPVFYRMQKIDPIHLASVEIWYRHDFGPWQKRVDPDRLSPYIFEADGDGRYFLYVRGVDHNGHADRPPPGPDTPHDMPVVVDTHSPDGELRIVGAGKSHYHRADDTVHLAWELREENMAPRGCSLEVSLDRGVSWTPLVHDLDGGAGEFRWRPPLIEAEALRFRLVARDLAENTVRLEAASRVFLINPMLDPTATSQDYHQRALVLAQRGDRPSLAAAVERLDIALSYNDANAAAWHDRGVVLTQLGELDRALDDYGRAHELEPSDIEYRFHLVEAHLNLHRTGDDPEHLEIARQLFSGVSKVDVYKSTDFRRFLTAYKVLESTLRRENEDE